VEYSAPQIADRAEPFRSKIRAILGGRTEELEALAVEMYARGLSTRDIEAVFADETGKSLLSRSAVSAVTERLWAEYEAFAGSTSSALSASARVGFGRHRGGARGVAAEADAHAFSAEELDPAEEDPSSGLRTGREQGAVAERAVRQSRRAAESLG
jgi:hypothetical protein